MITYLKFTITPSKTLFPEYPSFDLGVNIKDTGWIFTDLEYSWSCLPGYLSQSSGSVDVADWTSDNKGLQFYLEGKSNNDNYGILHDIPENFKVGSTGFCMIVYGGSRVKQLLRSGETSATLYSDWKLINAY
jgi:hypothetical protein